MCGIAGQVSLDSAATPETLARLSAALAHRGPDGEGTKIFKDGPLHVSFVHRRLKIIDLSERGAQPMTTPDGALSIIYNGEIYNYLELREELARLGHTFVSASDTEVLLASWRQWGAEMLPRLNGMFAFALRDAREKRVFLARDRFGEKPLFFRSSERSFAFASELPALLTALPEKPELNPEWLYRFFQFGWLENESATFVRGVERLLPGHFCEIRAEGERLSTRAGRWYSLPARAATANGNGRGHDVVREFRELFDDAVRLRLRSDVPVGSSLSGGIDSSAVVTTIASLLPASDSRHTFTCRMDDPRLDEGAFAAAVVERAHAVPHEVRPGAEELAADFEALSARQGEPFPSASIYAQYRVFRLAREAGVTVLLDGQGADETLAGYPFFAGVAASERVAHLKFGEARRLLDAGPANARRAMFVTAVGDAVRERAPRELRAALERVRTPRGAPSSPLVSRDARHRFPAPSHLKPDRGSSDWLDKVLRFSVERGGLQSLLRFADRNSMAFAREVRLPFLDHRLVEMLFALSEEWKIGGGMTKRVLREAMDGRVPDAVRLRRDKLGFEAPDVRWLTGPLASWFVERARRGAARFGDLLDAGRVEAAVRAVERGEADKPLVWALFPLVSAEACARNLFGAAS